MCCIFTATALIASICGVNAPAAFVGAGLGTIIYQFITKFESPMFLSNSGAYVAPVLMALQTGGYAAVAIGGLTSCIVYCLFGLIFSKISVDNIYKVFPKSIIGTVTCLIGLNLMTFIPTYIGDTGNVGIFVALFTMLVTVLARQYITKGSLSMFPFLIGLLAGYVVAIPFGFVDFSIFDGLGLFCMPTFAFTQWEPITVAIILPIVIIFTGYTITAMMECLADHGSLSNIISKDLYRKPGLSRIFIGEGFANLVSTCFGGLGSCSYGEGVGCVGFSKCASTQVTVGTALLLILLGFIAPVQAFIASIPSVVFAGTALVLYGFIFSSGIRCLQDSIAVNFNNSKTMSIISVITSIGIGGIAFSLLLGDTTFSFGGLALSLVVGVIMNLILKDKKDID